MAAELAQRAMAFRQRQQAGEDATLYNHHGTGWDTFDMPFHWKAP